MVRDDVMALLREELGAGYETASLAVMLKAHALRCLRPRLKALYAARLDDSALVSARQAKEQALATEEAQRKAALEAAEAQLDTDLAGV